MLFFRASDLTFTARHLHSWASFALWSSSFIFPGAIRTVLPSSTVACWAPSDLGNSSFSVTSFHLHVLFMGFLQQEYWSGCISLLQKITFCQNSLGSIHLGWPWMAWLIASLNYASPLTTSRLWYMKGRTMPKTCSGHNKHHFPTTTNLFQQSLSHTFFQYKRWLYT